MSFVPRFFAFALLFTPFALVAAPANYSVEKVRAAAHSPKPGLVLLAAHRGLWRNVPENTIEAVEDAVLAGFETVEIDVRLSLQQTPWLVHDYVLERLTDSYGYVSATADVNLDRVHPRFRDGTVSSATLDTLARALYYLGDYLTIGPKGELVGFVLVVDLKAPPKVDPNQERVSSYTALLKSWDVLKQVSASFPKLKPPGATYPALGPAVIFKMKARDVPDPATLEKDLGLKLKGEEGFYLEPVMHPDEANREHGSRVLKQYFDKPYAVGFEAVMEYVDQPVAKDWIEMLQSNNRTVPAFPSWSDYPEGVARSNGICCVYRNTDPAQPNLDYTGSFEFSLQIGGNWLTSDIAPFLHEYLKSIGLRDLDKLRPDTTPSPASRSGRTEP